MISWYGMVWYGVVWYGIVECSQMLITRGENIHGNIGRKFRDGILGLDSTTRTNISYGVRQTVY